MTASVSAVVHAALTVSETFDIAASNLPTIKYDAYDVQTTINGSSTPPITKVSVFAKALVSGSATIDLTALPGVNGSTVDGTGLKVQAVRIRVPSGNTNPLIIQPGASNGYNIFGATSKITLYPGNEFLWVGYDNAAVPDVAAGAKNIGLSDGGTGTESSSWTILLG